MSSSPSPVLSAEKRAWQYWFDDGVPTLVAGIGCLLGALFFAYDRSQNSTLLSVAIGFGAMLLYSCILIFQRQMIDWLKSKITYPRTGYTQPPYLDEQVSQPLDFMTAVQKAAEGESAAEMVRLREFRKQRVLLTCAAVGAAAIAMMYIQNRWICALAGVVMGLAFWVWGRGVYRLSWIVIGGFPFMGFMLGMVFGERVHGSDRVTYFLFAAGVLLVLDGGLTLLRYLRANPRTAQS